MFRSPTNCRKPRGWRRLGRSGWLDDIGQSKNQFRKPPGSNLITAAKRPAEANVTPVMIQEAKSLLNLLASQASIRAASDTNGKLVRPKAIRNRQSAAIMVLGSGSPKRGHRLSSEATCKTKLKKSVSTSNGNTAATAVNICSS